MHAVFGGAVDDQISTTVARYLPNDWVNTAISLLLLCHLLSAFVIILNPVAQHLELLVHVPPGATTHSSRLTTHDRFVCFLH